MVLILSVTTLVIFAGIGLYMRSQQKGMARKLASEAGGNVWYHPGHMWANFQDDGLAKVGIDKFLRDVLGRIDDVTLPSEGRRVKQGQPFLSVTHDGREVSLVSPLDGEVRSVNPAGKDDGYLVVLRPTHLKANMKRMKGHGEAGGWINSELQRFKDFITLRMGTLQEVGVTLADGGVHTEGIVGKMDEATFKDFTEKFLR